MSLIVTVACSCGRQMKATDPEPGDRIRCYYCGRSEVYSGGGAHDPESGSASMSPAAEEELGSLLEGLQPQDLTCPGCDAVMAVAVRDDGDKVAVCEYCGREADLPERRGVTRRRVRRSRGRTDITEETVWTEETSHRVSVPGLDVSWGRGTVPSGTQVTLSFDGDPDDPEALAEFLRRVAESLPPDQAKSVVAEMKKVLGRHRTA